MAGELTVSERILFHLSAYTKYEDKYESPFDVTQDGISQACCISRAHAAIELKKLKATGIVDERLSHVRRGKSRRKVYFLTMAGKSRAANVVQYVRDNNIVPMVDASKVSPELTMSRMRATRRSSPAPVIKDFFGRGKELEAINDALSSPTLKALSIRGIAGIGKTTLAAKLVSGLSGQRVFWYTAKPWDAMRTFAENLGKFFYDNGSRKLSAYLSSGKFEFGELSFLLSEELSENGYVFVFDDVDASAALQNFLKMFRHSSGPAKIITTSESQPEYYESSDVVARKEVVEIELAGLDRKSAVELLNSRGIEGAVAEELARATHGHPLSLEMVTASSIVEAKHQVSKFLEEKFYARLAGTERELLQLSSVFGQPFSSDAIPRELKDARKGSMLREVSPGKFEIHSSLREFVYCSMTREERVKWHSIAADYFLKAAQPQERLFHLIKAGRALEAEIMISRAGEELVGSGNVQQLWDALKVLEPSRPKYHQSVLLTKAKAARAVGAYDAAWPILEKVSGGERSRYSAEALVEMGRIKSEKGDLATSSKLFAEAMAQSAEFPCIHAMALRGLGVVEGKLGDFGKAQELLERSALDAMTAMDSKGMLMSHMELGNLFIGRGMYEQAIDHFSKCAAGFGPVELANVYLNMGVACASLGRTDEAKLNLENAIRLADETGQPRSKAFALTSLAELLLKSGRADVAKEHCFRALEIATELGDKAGVSAAYADLGIAERILGNMHESEEYYSESVSTLEQVDMPLALGMRRLEYGLLLKQMGDIGNARAQLKSSGDLFKGIGASDMSAKVDAELRDLDRAQI